MPTSTPKTRSTVPPSNRSRGRREPALTDRNRAAHVRALMLDGLEGTLDRGLSLDVAVSDETRGHVRPLLDALGLTSRNTLFNQAICYGGGETQGSDPEGVAASLPPDGDGVTVRLTRAAADHVLRLGHPSAAPALLALGLRLLYERLVLDPGRSS